MEPQVTSCGSAAEFLRLAGPYLEAREANHCLTLGICTALRDAPTLESATLLVASDGDRVLATAVWTPGHEVVVSEVVDVAALGALADALPLGIDAVHAPIELADAFAARYAARDGRLPVPPVHGARQRIYELQEVHAPTGVPGTLRRAEPGDREILTEWVTAFAEEATGRARRPDDAERVDRHLRAPGRTVYVWDDGGPVAMCASTGRTPTGIRISGVYTPPDLRRRGYGSACTAAASQAELDGGRSRCFLFTDLANPTSNRIYQAIGYRPVRDIGWYDLVTPS